MLCCNAVQPHQVCSKRNNQLEHKQTKAKQLEPRGKDTKIYGNASRYFVENVLEENRIPVSDAKKVSIASKQGKVKALQALL